MRESLPPLIVLSVLLALAGCAKDARISIAELRDLEDRYVTTQPVEVEPQQLSVREMRPYTVGAGDVLQITILGLDAAAIYAGPTIHARVHKDGQIVLPMAGAIDVAGLDLPGVERAVRSAFLPKFVKQEISVFAELSTPEGTTVMVFGAAGQRGAVTLKSNERNVLYALAYAQGFGAGSGGTVRVKPIRSDREEIEYNLNDVNDVRRALTAAPLESGDMLFVSAAKPNVIYTMGLLSSPGQVSVPENGSMSVLHTIAASGGLLDLAQRDATLWRTLPDGARVRVKLELDKIMVGEQYDLALRAGDVLEVPHTLDTRFMQWFNQNINLGPFGISTMYNPLAQYNTNRALRGSNGNFRSTVRDALQLGIPELLVPPVAAPRVP
ncbi:MAG: hypothetical protein CHACPFDD_00939 [Phycisphaerae bacterium]|nr:hypothetical protein [Phycisphaerae bacterium]